MNPPFRKTLLGLMIVLIVGSIWYLEAQKAGPGSAESSLPNYQCTPGPNGSCTTTPVLLEDKTEPAPAADEVKLSSADYATKSTRYKKYVEITNPSGFINTGGKPLTIKELIGKKVVLVDFWTYSCINCQRTLPYLTSWYQKYRGAGLEIISIHTPEFEFEKKYENVAEAARRFNIEYPIVQDNDYGTWRAYNNFYWPRKYLIDIDGFITYDHIGEGNYDETERKIQELLAERDKRLGTKSLMNKEIVTPAEAETFDTTKLHTPEIYFGASRNEYMGNGTQGVTGQQDFMIPPLMLPHSFYLDGRWDLTKEYAKSISANSRVQIRYQAQKVFIVGSADTTTRVEVFLDGKPLPSELRGADVSADGSVMIQDERLYRLIEGKVWGEHTLELRIEKPGLKAFTFTFG